MPQKVVILEPALHINLHYDLHQAWSKVQAALGAIRGEVACMQLELRVVEEVTHDQLAAVILPIILDAADEQSDGGEIPAGRRLEVVPDGHGLVAEVATTLGEPTSAGFKTEREDDEVFGDDDAEAVIWMWSPDASHLDRCYAWVRTHELDFVSSVDSGRVQMTVTQQVAVPSGGWVRIRTTLDPSGCTAVVEACVHGGRASSAEFVGVWSALQGVFGTLNAESVQCDELDEQGVRLGSVEANFAGVPVKKGSKFKAPKDPYKKRLPPEKPAVKKPKPLPRPRFIYFKGSFPLVGATPAERLAMLNAIVEALGESLEPAELTFSTYEVMTDPLLELLVDHCVVWPGMGTRTVDAVALADGQRADLLLQGEHAAEPYTLAAIAKLGEPDCCTWRARCNVKDWRTYLRPDTVDWKWVRQGHADFPAFSDCLVPDTLPPVPVLYDDEEPDACWPSTMLVVTFEGFVTWAREPIRVRATIDMDGGTVRIDLPLLAIPGDATTTALADRLAAVVGVRIDERPYLAQWFSGKRDTSYELHTERVPWALWESDSGT